MTHILPVWISDNKFDLTDEGFDVNEDSSEEALTDHTAIQRIKNGNDITKQVINHDANGDNKFDPKNDNLPMVYILNISGEDLPTKTAILFEDKLHHMGPDCFNSENQLTKQNGQLNDISCRSHLGQIERNLKYSQTN